MAASRTLLLTGAFLAAMRIGPALACGHCVEDRVAAVYDYGVELQAGREGMRVAYLGVTGANAESEASAAAVAAALHDIPVAEPETVRTSVSPAAASFAWRGDDTALESAIRTINQRLSGSRLRLELLRTWDARRGLH